MSPLSRSTSAQCRCLAAAQQRQCQRSATNNPNPACTAPAPWSGSKATGSQSTGARGSAGLGIQPYRWCAPIRVGMAPLLHRYSERNCDPPATSRYPLKRQSYLCARRWRFQPRCWSATNNPIQLYLASGDDCDRHQRCKRVHRYNGSFGSWPFGRISTRYALRQCWSQPIPPDKVMNAEQAVPQPIRRLWFSRPIQHFIDRAIRVVVDALSWSAAATARISRAVPPAVSRSSAMSAKAVPQSAGTMNLQRDRLPIR